MTSPPWPKEWEEMLRQLHADGLTFSQIANCINRKHGASLTRNSCIGKSHRLVLPRRAFTMTEIARMGNAARRANGPSTKRKPVGRLPGRPPRIAAEPKPPQPVVEAPMPDEALRLRLFDRSPFQCSWIEGEAKGMDTICCGAPVVRGSWCIFHAALGYTVSKPAWTPERRAKYFRSRARNAAVLA